MYRHIKAVNPDAIVLTPDVATIAEHRLRFLARYFNAGGSDVVDAFAIHTYRDRPEDPSLHEHIVRLNEFRAEHGLADHPMYFTEGEGPFPPVAR